MKTQAVEIIGTVIIGVALIISSVILSQATKNRAAEESQIGQVSTTTIPVLQSDLTCLSKMSTCESCSWDKDTQQQVCLKCTWR